MTRGVLFAEDPHVDYSHVPLPGTEKISPLPKWFQMFPLSLSPLSNKIRDATSTCTENAFISTLFN